MTAPPTPPSRATTRRRLLLLAAIGVSPIVASYTLYWLQPRERRVNYGALLATPAPPLPGTRLDGAPFALAQLQRQWVMLVPSAAACNAPCRDALYATRQARTMQNAERDRIARVWLVTDAGTPAPAVLEEHPDLVVARVPAAEVQALPGHGDAIYLVDPRGNLVLAWPLDPDIKSLAGDLARLLRASQIG